MATRSRHPARSGGYATSSGRDRTRRNDETDDGHYRVVDDNLKDFLNFSDEEDDDGVSRPSRARTTAAAGAVMAEHPTARSLEISGIFFDTGASTGAGEVIDADAHSADSLCDTDADESDGEIMNPYVMNAFPSATLGNDGAAAPLSPSMEMACVNDLPRRRGRNGGKEVHRRPPSRPLPAPSTTSATRTGRGRSDAPSLVGFDPYCRSGSESQRRLELEPEFNGESDEGEERIDHKDTRAASPRIGTSAATSAKDRGGGYGWQGDLLSPAKFPAPGVPSSPRNPGESGGTRARRGEFSFEASFESSFSPVPRHHPPQPRAEPRPAAAAAAGTVYYLVSAAASAIGVVVGSVLRATADAAGTVLPFRRRGRGANAAANVRRGDERGGGVGNPYSADTLGRSYRPPLLPPPPSWGTLAYFRLFVVAMAAFFALGTMAALSHVVSTSSASDDGGFGVTGGRGSGGAKSKIRGDNGSEGAGVVHLHRPSSLVKKHNFHKNENAKTDARNEKKRWWMRRKRGSETDHPTTEVYRNGERKESLEESEKSVPDANGTKDRKSEPGEAKGSENSGERIPIVVDRKEDGTLLIKLPPQTSTRAGEGAELMQQRRQQRALTEVESESDIDDLGGDEGEMMYIKLPYSADTPTRGREELASPPRGASPQDARRGSESGSGRGASTPLKRRPPLPLDDGGLRHENGHDHPHDHRVDGKDHGGNKMPYKRDESYSHSNSQPHHHRVGRYFSHEEREPGVLDALRSQFDAWTEKHRKTYGSNEENEQRFHVWKRNHFRVSEKNQKHGPCRITGEAVFGENVFSDLDPKEFQERFLTGYRKPAAHDHRAGKYGDGVDMEGRPQRRQRHKATSETTPPPASSVVRHPRVQRKLDEHSETLGEQRRVLFQATPEVKNSNSRLHGTKYQSTGANCRWWDVSCWLRWIFGYNLYGGTREPTYDDDSYPSALDWRDMGVVTSVRSQGNCGACWAITAVETVESAYAISTGTLVDLSEIEVIACDGTCEMCDGGWPQNAYDYIMKNGGLPSASEYYDGDFLYMITAVLSGDSDEISDSEIESYFSSTCPAGKRDGEGGGGGGGNSNSQNSNDNAYGDYSRSSAARYGNIKGYGYATDRCLCYSDGSGCDCEDQNEKMAVLNVASYGPSAVCLEASLWQDYQGGIMTSEIGCSSAFLDMNHCIQVVGYAFTDGASNGDDGGEGGNSQSGSGDNSNQSGSQDDGHREGYWIVRNQWSTYWGMNGYAYLAMGENTCGVLNDMTQAYMDN